MKRREDADAEPTAAGETLLGRDVAEACERHGQSRLIMPASIKSRLNRRASAPLAQR